MMEGINLRSWMTLLEQEAIAKYAKKCHSLVIELGTFRAGTTEILCQNVPADCVVITIDNYNTIDLKGYSDYNPIEIYEYLKKYPNCIVVVGDSALTAILVQNTYGLDHPCSGMSVDMVIVDAGHDYNDTKRNAIAWKDYTRYLIFHDYDPSREAGVVKAANEIRDSGDWTVMEMIDSLLILERR